MIEPIIKPQWYVRCDEMAKRSVDAVKNKELKIIPEANEKIWYHWLDNIKDWCVSRQLWWGHRIPAYLCKVEGLIDHPDTINEDHWVIARTEEAALEAAAAKFNVDKARISLEQDEDVLDTWFSSGLFPFYSLGWPNVDDENLKAFFPGQLLETGHDILFFWVARMVMMSLCLTDQLPFKEVYLHAMIRDAQGRKMSKSLGNVVDPLEVIDGCALKVLVDKIYDSNLPNHEIDKAVKNKQKEFPDGIPMCGSDALRFGLLAYMVQPRSINLDIKRIISYRLFCNKIWNSVLYALRYCDATFVPAKDLSALGLGLVDKWILSRLNATIRDANRAFAEYEFGTLANSLYDFWLKEFCDVYIEISKAVLASNDEKSKEATKNTLYLQ